MDNQHPVIGKRQVISLVQNPHVGLKHTHNLVIQQSPSLGLAQTHELDMDLKRADDSEISLGEGVSCSYLLVPAINQELALTHCQELQNEYDQGNDHESKYNVGDVDELDPCEDGQMGIDQDDSGLDKHDRQLTFTSQEHELGLSENNELAIIENHDIDDDLDLIVDQNHEMAVISSPNLSVQQPQFIITSSIVQSRMMTPAPTHELSVGQEFPDVKSCRRAARDAAIALHFELQTVKSDKTRFTAKCASEGCPWRIHAAKLPGVPTFTIRTIHADHTCGGIAHLGHQQASVQWVANSVEQRLRENPHYKPKEILEEIHRVHAANALTVMEFDAKLLEIEEMSPDAAYWVRRIPPRLWATSHFEGTRFGHLTANIVESLNSWILEASGLPVVQMMECIRRQLMTWFNERREASMQWTSLLVPSAERHVSEAIERARTYQVLRANEADFEVISHEGTITVDIRNRCCLCRGWQLYGLPCSHAVAALLSCRQNVHRFTESCFTVTTYRKTYSQTIHPIPDRTLWQEISEGSQNEGSSEDIVVNPPKTLRPLVQTRKRRTRTEDRGRVKRVVRCSRCNQTGHFRTTCAAPI
ncbi:unnamed protein product [Fraxinus pennsylvanica]|uniref:SWIM-type domain-containing protein n=1 Tax=Fraxinus pennsylvanica TaxID=56036 RepID=A0AAD1Z6J0_9LAMI|nr:unnamed protein product [Fraxinus pennsylvanica]